MITEEQTRETVASLESHVGMILTEIRTMTAEISLLSSLVGDLVDVLRPEKKADPEPMISIPLMRMAIENMEGAPKPTLVKATKTTNPKYERKPNAPRGDRRYASERVVVQPQPLISLEGAPSSMEMLAAGWKQAAQGQ